MNNQENSTSPFAKRVVKTSRWIHNDKLKVGMYVRELDRPWEETNFMFQGFVVDTPNRLSDVQSVAEYVCIESENRAS